MSDLTNPFTKENLDTVKKSLEALDKLIPWFAKCESCNIDVGAYKELARQFRSQFTALRKEFMQELENE